MRYKNIIEAERAAREFLGSVDWLKIRIAREQSGVDINAVHFVRGCLESGEVRRRSMDLTRALAKMRKT